MDELSILRSVAALLIVLALLAGLFWGLRRFSGLTPNTENKSDLKVTSWRPFDGRRRLAVIRWGDEEHLVLTGPTGDTRISSRKLAAQNAAPESSEDLS